MPLAQSTPVDDFISKELSPCPFWRGDVDRRLSFLRDSPNARAESSGAPTPGEEGLSLRRRKGGGVPLPEKRRYG